MREEKGGREHGGKSSEGREGATPRKCPCVMEVVVRGFFKSRVLPYKVFGLLFISKLQFSNRIIKNIKSLNIPKQKVCFERLYCKLMYQRFSCGSARQVKNRQNHHFLVHHGRPHPINF